MSETDYKKLGLKCGLEIHQQLSSGTKLFCRCPIKKTATESPSGLRSESFPIEVRRKLRAVAGEMGDVDPAALQEYLKNRTFVYKAHNESSCLVEIDEDPPKPLNAKSLGQGIQMCRLVHSHILDELHVMRKTVVDGSSPSGFQRTVLLGLNGYIEGEFGKIDIQTLTLEEDAGTPISRGDGYVEYRLDRLGIPLIEIATSSQIESPKMAKQVAEHIGMLLRSLDNGKGVVRGIGSIRQDINISIKGGERIEIKGFQELEKIPRIVENEVARQLSLLEIKDELKRRGLSVVGGESKEVTDIFTHTKSNFISRVLANKGHVYSMKLEKFAGLLAKQCGDRTFGKELSGYAASYGLGIMHSDEDVEKYNLSMEFDKLRSEMHANHDDLILITAGTNKKAIENALDLLRKRAAQCLVGVPKETRVADGEGSKYARPLPGSGRLYPESDVPPVHITKELLSIETPRTLSEKRDETLLALKKAGLKDTISTLFTTRNLDEAQKILDTSKNYGIDINTVAKLLIEIPKEIKSRFSIDFAVSDEAYSQIFLALAGKKIPESSVITILVDHLRGMEIAQAIKKYEPLEERELRKIVKTVVEENPGKKESVLMGLAMQRVQGRAQGGEISKILREMMQ